MPDVDLSHGIAIAFLTSNFTAEITDVTPPGAERGSVDTSHQGTTDFKTSLPEDLAEWMDGEFEIHFNPDTAVPINLAPETINIVFPLATGNTAAARWQFTGWMSNYKPQGPHLDLMVATVGIGVTGDITIRQAS